MNVTIFFHDERYVEIPNADKIKIGSGESAQEYTLDNLSKVPIDSSKDMTIVCGNKCGSI